MFLLESISIGIKDVGSLNIKDSIYGKILTNYKIENLKSEKIIQNFLEKSL